MTTVEDRATAPATEARVTYQEDVVRSAGVRRLLAVARIAVGFTFLWAFVDKVFGLGFSTPSNRAWIHGGSPTKGFLSHLDGPFAGLFSALSGAVWVDVLFMLGLLCIGVATILGAGLKIAAWSGTLLLFFLYLAVFPWGRSAGAEAATNPLVDQHWHEALLLLICAYTLAGDTWGIGRWWARIAGNGPLR